MPAHVEQFLGVAEEARARPVRNRVGILRRQELGLLGARLRERQQRGEPVRRRERGMAGVDDDLRVGGMLRQLVEHALEREVVQR